MKPELEKLLHQRYPEMFPERGNAMGDGVRCGEGWFDLIDTLCARLQHWTDQHGAPQLVAAQVKEKLGRLRFSAEQEASPEQLGMIEMAEAMSSRICESCGKPGQLLVRKQHCFTSCAEHAPDGSITLKEHLGEKK